MHAYSLDTDTRKRTIAAIAVLAFLAPTAINTIVDAIPLLHGMGFTFAFGTAFAILYWVFDRWLWRTRGIHKLMGIPVLAGQWTVQGISSYCGEDGAPYTYDMTVTIKQTASHIGIDAQAEHSSSSSTSAAIFVAPATHRLLYSYANIPGNLADPELNRHEGFANLVIISDSEMRGDYFSGRGRVRQGELVFTRTIEGEEK